jgi:hypothetical protein
MSKEPHLYSGNPDGKDNLIVAHTKKQLCEYFRCSIGYLNQYISDLGTKKEGNPNWNSKKIVNLTKETFAKEDNKTGENEK